MRHPSLCAGLAALALALSTSASATPNTMTHQGRLLDASGGPIQGSHTLDLSLVDGAGTALWTETQNATLASGYYAVVLGSQPANPLPASAFQASALNVEIAIDGGAPLSQPLSAVPFALRAAEADHADTATTATSVSGGTAAVTSLNVGSALSVDAAGNLATTGTVTVDGQTALGAANTFTLTQTYSANAWFTLWTPPAAGTYIVDVYFNSAQQANGNIYLVRSSGIVAVGSASTNGGNQTHPVAMNVSAHAMYTHNIGFRMVDATQGRARLEMSVSESATNVPITVKWLRIF